MKKILLILIITFLLLFIFKRLLYKEKATQISYNGATYYSYTNTKPLSKSECNELKDTLGIYGCPTDNDYWAGAVKKCGGVNKMPSPQEALNIYNTIKPNYNKFDFVKFIQYGWLGASHIWTNFEDFGSCSNKEKFVKICTQNYSEPSSEYSINECTDKFNKIDINHPASFGSRVIYREKGNMYSPYSECVERPSYADAIYIPNIVPVMIRTARGEIIRTSKNVVCICKE